ncbi:MAG: CBS domain-containing protein [Deltaproteobacteria bacterium]|nr:CBS domain-containing protein [Deltaproteobacteria bacterium]
MHAKTTEPLSVKDYMTAIPVTLTLDTEVFEAIRSLVQSGLSGAPVVDLHGNLVGIFSEQDCMKVGLRAAYHNEWTGKVSEFMSRGVQTVEPETSLVELAEKFLKEPFRGYPVVKDNRLVGQISRRDVLKALLKFHAQRESR